MENYLDMQNNIDEEKLKVIANEIKAGKTVLFPTETVYGIGTNGLNSESVKKVYQIKGRNLKNPINLLVSSINMVNTIAKDISDLEYKLMQTFFPGPFTIILKRKSIVPDIVTASSDTVGVRMPSGIIAKKLIEYSNIPIAAPSANISGTLSGTNLEDIIDDFSNKVDFIINGGNSDIGIESTIVKVINGIPHILRPGAITAEQIKKIAGNVIIENFNLPSKNLSHYQLNIDTILVYGKNKKKVVEKINSISKQYRFPVLLTFSENRTKYDTKNIIDIGSKYNLEEISRNIFTKLRQAEKLGPDIIIVEGIEKKGLGLAIMNRLLYACNNNYIKV